MKISMKQTNSEDSVRIGCIGEVKSSIRAETIYFYYGQRKTIVLIKSRFSQFYFHSNGVTSINPLKNPAIHYIINKNYLLANR